MAKYIQDELPKISTARIGKRVTFSKKKNKDTIKWFVTGWCPAFKKLIYLGTFDEFEEAEKFKNYVLENAELDEPVRPAQQKMYDKLYTRIQMKPKE